MFHGPTHFSSAPARSRPQGRRYQDADVCAHVDDTRDGAVTEFCRLSLPRVSTGHAHSLQGETRLSSHTSTKFATRPISIRTRMSAYMDGTWNSTS